VAPLLAAWGVAAVVWWRIEPGQREPLIASTDAKRVPAGGLE
jgi:hypothetical protein